MAQQPVGDKPGQDALATYRKLDERINAQMLAALHAAEAARAPEAIQDSRSAALSGGKGYFSALDEASTAAPPPQGHESELPLPPASFRMGTCNTSL